MPYRLWTREDGRRICIEDMTDRHLMDTLDGIEAGHIFHDYFRLTRMLHIGFELGFSGHPHAREYVEHRDRWLIVLQSEAIQRGLR